MLRQSFLFGFEEAVEVVSPRWVPEFAQGLGFDLAEAPSAPGSPNLVNRFSLTRQRPTCGKELAVSVSMQASYCSVLKDGDEALVLVPENKTVDFYKYVRGFG